MFNHILPKITRTQVVLSSFHLYVLRARQNELLIALAEAEANLSKDKLIGQEIKTNVLPTSVTED